MGKSSPKSHWRRWRKSILAMSEAIRGPISPFRSHDATHVCFQGGTNEHSLGNHGFKLWMGETKGPILGKKPHLPGPLVSNQLLLPVKTLQSKIVISFLELFAPPFYEFHIHHPVSLWKTVICDFDQQTLLGRIRSWGFHAIQCSFCWQTPRFFAKLANAMLTRGVLTKVLANPAMGDP